MGALLAPPRPSQPASERTWSFSFPGNPGGLAASAGGTVYVSDSDSGSVWRLDGNGGAEPFTPGWRSGNRSSAPAGLFAPAGMAFSPDGSLVVADPGRHRIAVVGPDRSVRVLAGGANGYRDGPVAQALFRQPADVAVAPDGTCYVADTGNHLIRAISPDGVVTTLAGSIFDHGDGRGPQGRFRAPAGLAVDGGGVIYVADTGNNAVRRVSPDGQVTTLAGSPPGGSRDGRGQEAALRWPSSVAVAVDGSLLVADLGNGAVRRITPAGEVSTSLTVPGLSYPIAVAALADGAMVVAGLTSGGPGRRTAWLIVARAGADQMSAVDHHSPGRL